MAETCREFGHGVEAGEAKQLPPPYMLCPFCGRDGFCEKQESSGSRLERTRYRVECLGCGAMGASGTTEEEAWTLWHVREVTS